MSDKKKYTIKDWLEGRVMVKVHDEKEYTQLMDIAKKNGIRWHCGNKATDMEFFFAPIVISCNKDFGGIVWEFCGGDEEHAVPLADILPDICRREIHIISHGSTTHAVLKENGKVTKRTMATCHPDDKYDFLTGARAALDRMQGKKPLSLEDVPTEKLVEEMKKRKNVTHVRVDKGCIGAGYAWIGNGFFERVVTCTGPCTFIAVENEEGKSK